MFFVELKRPRLLVKYRWIVVLLMMGATVLLIVKLPIVVEEFALPVARLTYTSAAVVVASFSIPWS